jgi:hypothetical protein
MIQIDIVWPDLTGQSGLNLLTHYGQTMTEAAE